MEKIDWIRKLTSRKFWAAIAGFVTGLIIAFGGSEATATQVTALIMAGASVVAYILGERLIDAASVQKQNLKEPTEEKPPEEE